MKEQGEAESLNPGQWIGWQLGGAQRRNVYALAQTPGKSQWCGLSPGANRFDHSVVIVFTERCWRQLLVKFLPMALNIIIAPSLRDAN
jgi:hypothetical protein